MEILIIIALIVAGLILFFIEVFLVPGITIAGIASACSLLYAIYYCFMPFIMPSATWVCKRDSSRWASWFSASSASPYG